jgi:hypothetical protein
MKPLLKSGPPMFRDMPPVARLYVSGTVAAGVLCMVSASAGLNFQRPGLFALLLVLAMATAAAKIDLPLGRGHSNLSLSHAVNFWALLALGPAEAVCIAAMSAWAQCTLRVGVRNPLHRILFSIGSLTLTLWLAGLPLPWVMSWGAPGFASYLRAAAIIAPL